MLEKVTKKCILCKRWIKRSQRKYQCLCHRCIERLTDEWIERRKKRDAHL